MEAHTARYSQSFRKIVSFSLELLAMGSKLAGDQLAHRVQRSDEDVSFVRNVLLDVTTPVIPVGHLWGTQGPAGRSGKRPMSRDRDRLDEMVVPGVYMLFQDPQRTTIPLL